jgi:hypothetical protein
MATTEPTINDAIASSLRELRHNWRRPKTIRSENTGAFRGAARPDILIVEAGTSPVAIETEVAPAQTVEKDARSRLGEILRENGKPVLSSVAVRLSQKLRHLEGKALADELSSRATFEFACFMGRSPEDATRWPSRGWMTGDIREMSLLCQSMTIPPAIVDDAADRLVQGVSDAAGHLDELAQRYDGALKNIATTLKQEDGIQTRRMAMTIVANAFVFHASLAGQTGDLADVRSIEEIRGANKHLSKTSVLAEWRKILKINYWPIFDIARRIVEYLPSSGVAPILTCLADTAELVLESGLTQSHDLVGAIFQKLIADRKFLAAFYTKPQSAMLLARLALSRTETPLAASWTDPKNILALRFADFACGTGTLLSTVYQCVRQYHELAGGDEVALHPAMMSDVLTGCDIMPAAAHITASMLSGAHPSVKYTNSSIMTMPYGKQDNISIALGSLDLLQAQGTFPLLATHAAVVSGHGERPEDTWRIIPDRWFHLVIMNPPFTRPTNHEGNKIGVPNPMFAAFDSSGKEQKEMSKRMEKATANTVYNGNAGEASAFVALADRKLAKGGMLAMVLPLSLQMGGGWEDTRALFARSYSDLCVVNIASETDEHASFSADTGMAECLVIARKTGRRSERGLFVILERPPATLLEGSAVARTIRELRHSQAIRRLEDGPVGGTSIRIGDDLLGNMIDGPVPTDEPWPISRVSDVAIAQSAYQLVSERRLWLPGMEESEAIAMPMCRLASLAEVGPLHRDINGKEYAGDTLRGPFDIVPLPRNHEPTYPVLWSHDADMERAMLVAPDSQAVLRKGRTKGEDALLRQRAAKIARSASRCHFNYDFRFNSQSTAACCTKRPSIGGRAWPSLSFQDASYEEVFVLWANSTLGLLCHWWHANKQQTGRGSITITALPNLAIYDFGKLTKAQLQRAGEIFEQFKSKPMRPFNEIDSDSVRHDIDKAALEDVFGIPARLLGDGGPIDLFRRKLAREPSIRGAKKVRRAGA